MGFLHLGFDLGAHPRGGCLRFLLRFGLRGSCLRFDLLADLVARLGALPAGLLLRFLDAQLHLGLHPFRRRLALLLGGGLRLGHFRLDLLFHLGGRFGRLLLELGLRLGELLLRLGTHVGLDLLGLLLEHLFRLLELLLRLIGCFLELLDDLAAAGKDEGMASAIAGQTESIWPLRPGGGVGERHRHFGDGGRRFDRGGLGWLRVELVDSSR